MVDVFVTIDESLGIVSSRIGWIKSVLGFRQFSLRGLRKTNAEWHLVCLAMNLRRMSEGIRLAAA